MAILFTILLPVHRNADLIPFAIQSVLAQTIQDFELFIICDGAPLDTITCAQSFAEMDHRIDVFSFPKGKRHGEAHRHIALQQAKGSYITHIADDDFWFPNHLEEMSKLLQHVDFGNLTACLVDTGVDNSIYGLTGDLHNPETIHRMITSKYNFFGITTSGYTLAAYQSLSQGWSPAPDDIWTDLYMWRKFLRTPGLTFGTRAAVTACHFGSPTRKHLSTSDRKLEMAAWFEKMQCKEQRDQCIQQVLKKLNQKAYLYEINYSKVVNFAQLETGFTTLNNEIFSIYHSLSWRMTKPLRIGKKWLKKFLLNIGSVYNWQTLLNSKYKKP